MYDVFISHNKQQKPWVREVVRILREGGLKVFFDEDTIAPGESIVVAIENAISCSKYILFIISPTSIKSRWVAMETALTIYDDPDAVRRKLIPVILESIDFALLRPTIRSLNHIDLTNTETRDYQFKKLLEYLGLNPYLLPSIPKWPIGHAENKVGVSERSLLVADINDVVSWGWSGNRLLNELIKLDYETIEGLSSHHEGSANQWDAVFMDHPDTWRLLINGPGSIIGYWHFVPLFQPEYEQAKKGFLMDSQITTDKVQLFELPGLYNIYFVSICIKSQYRRIHALRMLFESLRDIIIHFASGGIFFREACTNAYTGSGESLCKTLGMTCITNHTDHGQIYWASFNSLLTNNSFFKESAELKKYYHI
jgi:hypothetical protein